MAPPTKESEKSKISESLDHLKKNENVNRFMNFAKHNKHETVAFFVLLFGLIWMLASPFYGGILIGLLAGFYFYAEILEFVQGYAHFLNQDGLVKRIVLSALGLVFFLLAPGIFVGAAIMVALKFLLKSE